MTNTKILKFALLSLALTLPQLVNASSLVVSTIKNPDPYSGNYSWLRYNEPAGSEIKDAIVLKNLGDQTEKIKLYATDSTSNQAGSFVSKLETETQKTVGLWTKLEKNEVTVEPNQTVEVGFSIKIPEQISPGEYFGSIIKEDLNTPDCTGSSCGNIQIKTRTGNRIYLTVPGELKPDIRLSGFSSKPSGENTIFKFTFVNKGNVSFQPQATINIYNFWGKKVDSLTNILGQSLPGTTIEPQLAWNHNGKFGQFKVQVEINYLQDNLGLFNSMHGTPLNEMTDLKIIIVPWNFIFIISSLLLLSGLTLFARRKYYQRILSGCTDYLVDEDENIMDLSEKNNLSWKTIARLNHLKPPYILHKGQSLKIPKQK